MSNQQNIFNRQATETLCEIAYMVATSGFNPSHINEIDSNYDYTVGEALEFYEWIKNSIGSDRGFLDRLYSLKLKDYKNLAEGYILYQKQNNPYF